MTQLRRMMLEELQRPNYSEVTTRNYLRVVTDLARHFGKSQTSSDRTTFETTKPTCSKGASWHPALRSIRWQRYDSFLSRL
jgi:hypothetical protein